MPMPNHCVECDNPLTGPLETLVCGRCREILDGDMDYAEPESQRKEDGTET